MLPAPLPSHLARVREWLAFVGILTALFTSTRSASARGPEDMPDVDVADLDRHPIPRTPSDYIHHEVGWVLFVYPRDALARVEPLMESANQVRRALRDELGESVLAHIEVRVTPDPEQMAALAPDGLPPPSQAVGVTYARHRLILLSLRSPDRAVPRDLAQVYRHQLAHVALFDAVAGHEMPRWFMEGYAINSSSENGWSRSGTLWRATLSDRLLPLSLLDGPFRDDDRALATAQSADFLRFLSRRQDRDRFKQLIGRLERGESFHQALEGSYAAPLRSLEREWHDDLDDRYNYVPVMLGTGLLCALGLGIVGARWIRRRNRRIHPSKEAEIQPKRARQPSKVSAIRVTLTPRSMEGIDLAALRGEKVRNVPKVEHDGEWHTLH